MGPEDSPLRLSVVNAAVFYAIVGIAAEAINLMRTDSSRRRRHKRSCGPGDRRELVRMSPVLASWLSAGRRRGRNQSGQRDHKGQRSNLKGRHNLLHLPRTSYRTSCRHPFFVINATVVARIRRKRCDVGHKIADSQRGRSARLSKGESLSRGTWPPRPVAHIDLSWRTLVGPVLNRWRSGDRLQPRSIERAREQGLGTVSLGGA
jgi:hypothetical protein